MVSFTPRPLYPHYPFNMKLGRHQANMKSSGEEKFLALAGTGNSERPHSTKRRRDIRCPDSGMPASFSIGPALKPQLETGYPEREFNDFPQTLHTNPGIIPLISPRSVLSISFPTLVPFDTTQCAPPNHRYISKYAVPTRRGGAGTVKNIIGPRRQGLGPGGQQLCICF